MFVLKIVTTVLIGILVLIVLFFVNGMIWEKDKASIIGFGFMEIVYVLSLICMWVQKYVVCPGSEGAVLKIVGCKRLAGANPAHGVCGMHISAYPLEYPLLAARMILLRTERDRPAVFGSNEPCGATT